MDKEDIKFIWKMIAICFVFVFTICFEIFIGIFNQLIYFLMFAGGVVVLYCILKAKYFIKEYIIESKSRSMWTKLNNFKDKQTKIK